MAPPSGSSPGAPIDSTDAEPPIEVALIANDRERAAEIATGIQAETARFEVRIAVDAAGAVEQRALREVDCVLIAVDDGLGLYRELQASVPVPFVMIVDDDEAGVTALDAGVSAVHRRGDGAVAGQLVGRRIADVVDRRRTETVLDDHARRLETLIGNLPGMVYRCRFKDGWPMEYVRGECEKLTGYAETALENGDVQWGADVIHPDDRSMVWETIAESVKTGDTFEFTYRILTAEGTTKWVWERGQRIRDDGDGRIEGFITDVSDRREREQQLQVIGHLLRHNVRNDMTIIRGHAEAIRDGCDSPEAAGETIIERADQLCGTVEKARPIVDILTNTRDLQEIDLQTALERIVDDLDHVEPATTIDVTVPESICVAAVPELERGLYELLENAVTHQNGDRSPVEVVVEETDRTVSIRIVDDGPTIPEMEIATLAGDRNTDQLYHGSGLGLWLAEWIVRRSGGTLSFDRPESGGNVVTVTLDRYQE